MIHPGHVRTAAAIQRVVAGTARLLEALASPSLAWLLLMIGAAGLYIELKTPGIGFGGFVSMVAFIVYFWSQYLNGTSGWLEVMLFIAGVICVAAEIFVLPGFGVLGLGGGLLVIASIEGLLLSTGRFGAFPPLPRSVIVLDWAGTVMAIGGIRALWRSIREELRPIFTSKPIRTAIIVGADETGELLARTLMSAAASGDSTRNAASASPRSRRK